MKNITLAVDDETYRQARLLAAKREQSVSALVRDLIQESASNPAVVIRETRATYQLATPAKKAERSSRLKKNVKEAQVLAEKPAKEMSFLEFMRASPLYGLDIEFPRDKSLPRQVNFDA